MQLLLLTGVFVGDKGELRVIFLNGILSMKLFNSKSAFFSLRLILLLVVLVAVASLEMELLSPQSAVISAMPNNSGREE